jgi:asparagine synthetase B (glutamine-hydrolysing)
MVDPISIDAGVDLPRFTRESVAQQRRFDALTSDHLVCCADGTRSLVVRSYTSQQPLFLERLTGPNRFRLGGLSAVETCATDIDLEWLADYVAYQVPLTLRTCREGLSCIRPGMCLEIDNRSGAVGFTFPELRPLAHSTASSASTERIIREKLIETIRRSDPLRSVFHLSSGLDSSLLLLLATQIHGAVKLRAATFEARGRGASDELEVVRRLADELGIALAVLDFRDIDIWSSAERMMDAYRVPVGHPSALARFLMDEAIVARDAEAIVTGRGADELFGGYAWHLPEFVGGTHHDRVRATPPHLMRSLFPHWQRDAERNYNDFFADSYGVERRLQYDLATLGGDWCFIDAQLSRYFSVKVVAPFCDRALQIAAYGLRERAKIADRKQKVVLRQLFKDVFPDYLLDQPKLGLSFDITAYLRQYTAAEILRRLDVDWLDCTTAGLSRPTLQKMVDDTLAGRANYGWQIWSFYLAALAGRCSNRRNREMQ